MGVVDTREDLLFAKENGYSIYQYDSEYLGVYFLCIPDNQVDNYELFIGFPKKDLKELPKDEVIEEIKGINDMVYSLNNNAIYALPSIDVTELEEAALENDNKRSYNQLFRKVQSMTVDINKKISSINNHEQSINQVITIIKQTESDSKFIQWLEMNMPNFIHGITLSELRNHYYANNQPEKVDGPVLEKEEIMDIPVEKEINYEVLNKEENDQSKDNTNNKVRKLVPQKKNNNFGFSNMSFILMVLTISLLVGISIGYLIIR